MKRSHRRVLGVLALLGTLAPACGPDRRAVVTYPRRFDFGPEPQKGPVVKGPPAVKKAPDPRPLPPSNGVDVPMIEPD
jgi:hypothetical protein